MMNALPYSIFDTYVRDLDTLLFRLQMERPLRGPDTDFVTAKPNPRLGYPVARLEFSKLKPSWDSAYGEAAIGRVGISDPLGFAENIYFYDSKHDNPFYEGAAMGHRYLGATYGAIFLGFPIYFIKEDDAVAVLRKAFQDFGQF